MTSCRGFLLRIDIMVDIFSYSHIDCNSYGRPNCMPKASRFSRRPSQGFGLPLLKTHDTSQDPTRPAPEPRLATSTWLAHSSEFVGRSRTRRRQRFEDQIRTVLSTENKSFRVASQP